MTDISGTGSTPAPSRRPWIQFSLRTLLLAMLVFGCGLGWFADKRRKSQQAWAPIRAIHADGLHFLLDGVPGGVSNGSQNEKWLGIDLPRPPRTAVVEGERISSNTISQLVKLSSLENVRLNRGWYASTSLESMDTIIAPLSKLPNLHTLRISDRKFTGSGLRHFVGRANILHLDLTYCFSFKGEGFACLSEFTKLKTLDLSYTGGDDSNIGLIRNLESLEVLDLRSTKFTETGVFLLLGLKSLRELHIETVHYNDVNYFRLAEIKSLKTVSIGPRNLSGEDVNKLRKLRPGISVVSSSPNVFP